jgi:hypothetical protein
MPEGPLDVERHPTPRRIEMIALILRSNPDQFHQKVCSCKNSNNLFIHSKNLFLTVADNAHIGMIFLRNFKQTK